jgi:DNA-binding NtrC family response regulator
MIKKALAETRGNKSQAAEKLGLSRRGFLNKLERYRIAVEEK